MNDSKHTRRSPRPPQPPLDPARLLIDTRWQKNRAEDIDKPPRFDVIDYIEMLSSLSGEVQVVHYHDEATKRRGKMPLKDFCAGSEHREPDAEPVEEAPVSGQRETAAIDIPTELRAIRAAQDEILALLKHGARGQLALL